MLSNLGRLWKLVCIGIFSVLMTVWPFAAHSKPSQAKTPVFMDYYESRESGQEFKIKIPPKWIAEVGTQRFAVTLKPSSKAERIKLPKGVVADPSITVAVVKKPVTFNQESLDATAKEIEESFIRFNGAGSEFQIFQKNLLRDLPGGHSGLLYYVSFKTDGVDAGQAILVMGDETVRYRVTLSDHRLNFDRNLELYYPYMTSLEFKSAPQPQSTALAALVQAYLPWAVAAVAVFAVLALLIKGRRNASGVGSVAGGYPASGVSNAPTSLTMDPTSHGPASMGLSLPSASGTVSSRNDPRASAGGPEYSMIPQSMIGVADQSSAKGTASEPVEQAFSDKDLSAPPQSIPLSQVVDEETAPPELKKRWQIFTKLRK